MNSDRQPDTVKDYLAALRRALKGAPAGLIADALSDAEEHLDNEIIQNPNLTETAVLASVIETYGTPEEIAEEYRSMEASITSPFPKSEEPPQRRFGFFNVISDPHTYGSLLYMLLSLVTGTFYFTWVVTGLSLSVGLFILIIGIPFALLFIGSVRVLALIEGRLVEGLLGVRMPRRLPAQTAADETIGTKIKDALLDVRTWSSMLYLALMLPLGVAYFTIAVVGIVVPVAISGASLYALVTNNVDNVFQSDNGDLNWLNHFLHTAPGLLTFAIGGLIVFFIVLHLVRGIGWLHGRIAEALLVRL
ncbi:MAG TPA: sensor domain-containing protein [Rhizomicrobium sp.]|jgi:uncharacterized membrane protein|nr:sensor domain-containing protein [Rhizomicrobium sp.]